MICEMFLVSDNEQLSALQEATIQAARILKSHGLKLREPVTVCGAAESLATAIATGLARSNIIITIGGMGPDMGYLSKRVVAEGLRMPLADNLRCLSAIQVYCERKGEVYMPQDATLASLPKEARAFLPQYGKLPGCVISSSRQHIIMLPENIREILPMLQSDVLPYLADVGVSGTDSHYVRAVGIKTERVEGMLADLTATANPVVTVESDRNEVLVRVGAQGADRTAAAALCTPVLQAIVERLGDYAYGLDVDSLEAAVIKKMRNKRLGLAVVEHGTDGVLTRMLTETEHGQEVLRYTTAVDELNAAHQKLNIPLKKLKKHGVVSEYAAVAMANAARVKVAAHIGIAVCTAPPEYGNEKDTGVVFIAVCDRDSVYVKKLVVSVFDEADGDAVIDASVARALNMLRLFVDYYPERYHASIPLFKALDGRRNVTDHDRYEDNAFGDILVRPRQSAMSAILGNFIFRRGDGLLTIMKKFIFILSLLVFLGCSGYLGYYYYGSFAALKAAEQLRDIYYAPAEVVAASEAPEEYPENYENRFASLWLINPDIVGFLKIDNTRIDYPVVQAEDNEYYLRRAFDGSYSNHGVPFLDYRADAARPSDNLVIYGHNMRDGQAFADLISYKDVDFYKQHPIVSLNTVHAENKYAIFAVFITNAEDTANGGEVFNYHDMVIAASDEDFAEYVHQIKVRSILDTGLDVIPGDELLTLSTCSDEYFTGARFVVVARALRDGEESVNVSGAMLNPTPLYPEVWYENYGGSRPDIPSASVVTTPVSSSSESSVVLSSMVASSSSESEPEASEYASSAAESSRIAAESASASASASLAEVSRMAAESSSLAAIRLASEAAASSRAAASSAAASQAAVIKQHEDNTAALMQKAEEEFLAAISANEKAEGSSSAAEVRALAKTEAERAERLKNMAAQAKTAADNAGTEKAGAYAGDVQYFYEESVIISGFIAQKATELEAAGSSGSGVGSVNLDKLSVTANGQRVSGDALNVVARIVQNEVGSSFHVEAIKAQAVAAYTYVAHSNSSGSSPSVYLASSVDTKVLNAVKEVIGEAVYYNGALAHTTYFATSNGSTTSSRDVWGGSYPYLVSVDSSVDEQHPNFAVEKTMTRKQVSDAISSKLGITPTGSPEDWFEIISYADGGYNGLMSICGQTKSRAGSTITGRLIRESVLSLRSACFDIDYDSRNERFTFTSYGYGHGVGMSQNGANYYAAQQGWDYIDILEHYYPGTRVG